MPSHGGKRPGAGRKKAPSDKRRVAIATTVDAETARKVRAEAERRGIPVGALIDDMAKRLPDGN